ncbi:hypothetical protein Agub_g5854 [Astrephomene gubernaculifera]|uniref:SET domain-containing protein n=1 Tax=Astrephomene gubernaculifera TaxID=47775 RepID=A0AAD3DMG4_9CHLO|nr:hypothetical protein Agub_g5854 [Astrephomene gubernaculifera]
MAAHGLGIAPNSALPARRYCTQQASRRTHILTTPGATRISIAPKPTAGQTQQRQQLLPPGLPCYRQPLQPWMRHRQSRSHQPYPAPQAAPGVAAAAADNTPTAQEASAQPPLATLAAAGLLLTGLLLLLATSTPASAASAGSPPSHPPLTSSLYGTPADNNSGGGRATWPTWVEAAGGVERPAPRQASGSGSGSGLLAAALGGVDWRHQLRLAAWELAGAAGAAAALVAYQERPRGWARRELLEVRASPISGRGVFARAPIPSGTLLGSYPGRLRSGPDMLAKCRRAPGAAAYAFKTGDGRFLDPTDLSGAPSPFPQPGPPWPLPLEVALAFVNEPPKHSPGTNVTVEDGPAPGELLFVAAADIAPGAELLIDYGTSYDRSQYGSREEGGGRQ